MEYIKTLFLKILNTENKQNIAKNSVWLVFDHFLRIVFGLLVGAWVARYLGPSDFGKLNYVLAFVSFLAPFYLLGLEATLPKEFINTKDEQEKTLASAFFLKLTGSIFIFILSIVTAFFFHPEDKIIFFIAFFIGLSYIFKAFDVLDIWFLNRLESKYTVIARNVGLTVSALFKIFFIIGGFGLIYFSFTYTLEAFILAIVLITLFIRTKSDFRPNKIEFDFQKILKILKDSWIICVLGFLNMGLLNIDKLMIKNMLGVHDVGVYSVATSITFLFIVLGEIIVKPIYPILISLNNNRPFNEFTDDIQKIFDYLTISAYFIIFCVFIGSNIIIPLIWGNDYAYAANILYIQIFSILFLFLGLIIRQWIVIKNLMPFFSIMLISGFALNIILNYVLINKIGVIGSAWATSISYFYIFVVFILFHQETRKFFIIQIKALFLINCFKFIFKKAIK